jgi:hypothetical protein
MVAVVPAAKTRSSGFSNIFSPYVMAAPTASWCMSVSIVSDYRLDHRDSILGRGKGFFSSPYMQTSFEADPASYPVGTEGPFSGCKARPGGGAWRWPLTHI